MKHTVRLAMIGIVFSATALQAAEPRPLTALDLWKIKRVGSPSVSPDGQWCVVDVTTWDIDKDESSSNLWLLSTNGKTQKQLTNTTGKNGGPKWAPDGLSIAFTSQRAGDDGPQIYVISPIGGEARRVSTMAAAPTGLKWAADCKTIYSIGWTWPDATDDATHKAKEKALKDQAVTAKTSQTRSPARWATSH